MVVRPRLRRPQRPVARLRHRREPVGVQGRRRGLDPAGRRATPTSTAWPGTRTSRTASTSATTAACTAPTTTAPTWEHGDLHAVEPAVLHRRLAAAPRPHRRRPAGQRRRPFLGPRRRDRPRDVERHHRRRRHRRCGSTRRTTRSSTGAASTAPAWSAPTAATAVRASTPQIHGERKNWLTPIEFDPVDPSTVYTASYAVHRSTNDGQDWEIVSLDLTDGEQGSTETNPLFRNYNTVSTLAVTDADTGFLLAGTDDGHVWYSHDAAATVASWTESTDPDLPKHYVTSSAIDLSAAGRRVRDVLRLPLGRGAGDGVPQPRQGRLLGRHQRRPAAGAGRQGAAHRRRPVRVHGRRRVLHPGRGEERRQELVRRRHRPAR